MKHNDQVKWTRKNGTTATGRVFISGEDQVVLQDASMIHGDGTREERLAERARKLAACVEIKDGQVVVVNGAIRVLRYNGDYMDAFKLVRHPADGRSAK